MPTGLGSISSPGNGSRGRESTASTGTSLTSLVVKVVRLARELHCREHKWRLAGISVGSNAVDSLLRIRRADEETGARGTANLVKSER